MRSIAFAAPLSLLAYGVLRWIDGWDGDRGGGPAWNLGHTFFLLSVLLFVVLAAALHRLTAARRDGRRAAATVALAATVIGAGCMAWVIIGDLFKGFHDALPLPHVLEVAGPPAFALGIVTLLLLRVAARDVPWWSPVLFLLGFVAISIDLNLLPAGALLITGAMVPVAGILRPRLPEPATAAG